MRIERLNALTDDHEIDGANDHNDGLNEICPNYGRQTTCIERK